MKILKALRRKSKYIIGTKNIFKSYLYKIQNDTNSIFQE